MDECNSGVRQHDEEELSESSNMILAISSDVDLSSEVSTENTNVSGSVVSVIDRNIPNSNKTESASELTLLQTTDETIIDRQIQPRPPSLTDDSKLVKFSLPSNSKNFIQSNAQFLNKSRHLINFITEKSTNIMEKALLPQHSVVKCNNNTDTKMSRSETNSLYIKNDTKNCTNSITPITSEEEEGKNSACNEKCEETGTLESNADEPPSRELNSLTGVDLLDDRGLQNHVIEVLKKRIELLEERNNELEMQSNLTEIENRDRTIERLTIELRGAMINQEKMRKNLEATIREKENMVMKYAVGEKQLIETQKAKDIAERKVKELFRDNDLLQTKLRQSLGERTRICGMLDVKCRELTEAQKDVEKFKEEIEIREIKLKWTQNKLKSEMEIYKENAEKLEKAIAKINEMKDECDQVRREAQETIRNIQQLEVNKAATLDQQLKEQQAKLILERHLIEDKEMSRLQLQKEVETLKNQQHNLIEENNLLSLKIQDLDQERLTYELDVNKSKIIVDEKQREIVDLNNKLSQLETIKLQLIHKDQCLVANETELERLRRVNQELQTDMDCCRQREAHMLDFTQKLTDKNVRLQSEFSVIESKANQLEMEQGPQRQYITELGEKMKLLEDNLLNEKSKRIEECEILAKHVAEQTQLAQNLTQMLEDSKGENSVLRRKYQSSMKEMTRELNQCRKKLEAFEITLANDSLGQASRASSDTSLNTADIPQSSIPLPDNHRTIEQPTLYNDLDKDALIERILKMQRINVRRAEKLDFLEEHTRALVIELQRKTKIIQNYILHENFDAMGSNERDKYKNLKSRRDTAELVRHGGIMASVYNHKISDDNMTLELSLEINQKLQAVLEDALLKNITLKDNIDTLGEEIARLSIQNQHSQKMPK